MPTPADWSPSAEFVAQVTRAQRSLYGFITTLLWRPADVEDVLQETNLVLWRKAAEFDTSREFMPWALRIAQFQAMAHLKKQRKRPLYDTDLLDRIAAEAVMESASTGIRRQALAHCLQKLSDKHRQLVSTRYEPGASVKAMAAATGKQPKAVSETLRRIRRTLLDCIERRLATDAAITT
jgi:RNA polymerase sigma-70 factor (ECF subfamily)